MRCKTGFVQMGHIFYVKTALSHPLYNKAVALWIQRISLYTWSTEARVTMTTY